MNRFYPQEKVYIHTDKSQYLPGGTIWFKVYLAEASTHMISPNSKIVHVELSDTSGFINDDQWMETFQVGRTGGGCIP